jgi:hypothetical protein
MLGMVVAFKVVQRSVRGDVEEIGLLRVQSPILGREEPLVEYELN